MIALWWRVKNLRDKVFFFQAEDGIRDYKVTGVQTCALPIFSSVTIAGGIEARLIEAEAALKAGDNATWIAKLNTLRADTTLYPSVPADTTYKPRRGTVLGALAVPATQEIGRAHV